jgi:ATP-dependent helicase Lhr and Lhr-like helicase
LDERQETLSIRKSLKHAWTPFFGRFGRLTPVQRQVIPKILRGQNTVIASPTASGKTEAVVAPLAELFVTKSWRGMAILYIVPTRALANDSLMRIQGPLSEMDIKTELKHGDRPALSKIPNCLITTPESLDSLLCRRSEILQTLSAVVLDEIHLLDNTYRGDQLRLLMRRLKKTTKREFSVNLISATLFDPDSVGLRYTEQCESVIVPGARKINACYFQSPAEVCDYARSTKLNKLLAFCNFRESVEKLGSIFEPLWKPYPVVVHHGSLGRSVREEAEKVMQESRTAICVATSTLEIGIDIGDIDLIVLAEPPYSIASLAQRIGRGNRRKETIDVAVMYNSDEEKLLIEERIKSASVGLLAPLEYKPDLSVIIQQALSILFQHPEGRRESELQDIFTIMSSEDVTSTLLSILSKRGWVEFRGGRWFGTTKLRDEGEKGKIHSNIQDSQLYAVMDIDSGNQIGSIVGAFDEIFTLGGRNWKITSVIGGTIYAKRFSGIADAPAFRRSRNEGRYASWLPDNLRKISKRLL